VAKTRRRASYKYPGWLGKPADPFPLYLDANKGALESVRDDPDWSDARWDAAWDAALDDAMQRHGYRVLFALMDHFGIDPRDAKWGPKLAWKLAALHVPANQLIPQGKPGRPRTAGPLNSLARLSPRVRKRPGAPTKWTDSEYRSLLDDIERGKSLLRQAGKPVTNAAALYAARGDRRTAKAHARRVSDATKALRKPKK
jgi:hypothetical protein